MSTAAGHEHTPLILTGMGPAYGLPSWCPRTLEAQLLLKLCDADAKIVNSKYPYSAATEGELPTVLDGSTLVESRDVCSYLATRYNIDSKLEPSERAECVAFNALLHTQLHAALTYVIFGDDFNLTHSTSALLSRNLPFAAAFFVQQRSALLSPVLYQKLLLCEALNLKSLEQCSTLAQSIFQSLEDKMSSQSDSFFSVPSSFDATLAAYLTLITHIRLPKNPLLSALQAHPRLSQLATQILHRANVHVEFHLESRYYNVERVRTLLAEELAAAETKKQTEQRRWSAEHRNEANKHKYFLLSAGLGLAAYIVWAFRDRNAPKAEP